MYVPELITVPQTKDIIQEFRGYNHNIRIADNEFYDMKNMTSKYYPVLSPRDKRGMVANIPNCNGIIVKDKLVYVKGNELYYGFENVLTLKRDILGERSIVSMGAYIVIYPDMMYYNTANPEDKGNINNEDQTFTGNMTLTLADANGNDISPYNMLYETNLKGCPFWSRTQHYNYKPDNEGDGMEYIVVNPFKHEGTTESIKLYGLPSRHTEQTDSVFISYDWSVEYKGYGEINGEKTFQITNSNDYLGIYFRPQTLTALRNELVAAYAKEKYTGENYGYPEFGKITITRTVMQQDLSTVIDEQKEVYHIVSRIKAELVSLASQKYEISAWGEQWAIKKGDYRLIHKDGKSVVEECIDYAPEDTDIATWNNGKCWEEVQTYVRIDSDNQDIGSALETIINDNSSEVLSIDGNNSITDTLDVKYNDANVNFARDSAVYIDYNSIKVKGALDYVTSATENISISFKNIAKVLDYVIECNNRLWGCRYGKNNKGDFVNEIYATELGSFRNWDVYQGTASDSYTVSLGSDGAFTGAINYNGKPMFFKENCIHTVYGSYPENYAITTDTGAGLQNGSHKSLALLGNTLFYKAIDGIYVYDGASSHKISDAFGSDTYTDAVGGAASQKYYVTMKHSESGERSLFVYDTTLGVWHKEDDADIAFFARNKTDLYLYDKSDGVLYNVNGSTNKESDPVEWYCESGNIGFSTPDSKYISKLQIRMVAPVGSHVSLYAQYDSDGYWEYIGGLDGTSLRAFTIPFMPRKCDHFKIRIEGKGECKIYSMSKVMLEGGEY